MPSTPAWIPRIIRSSPKSNCWSVVQSEMGYRPKEHAKLSAEDRTALEAFLETLDDHDDVHRIYTT